MFINAFGKSIFKSEIKEINLKEFDALNISSDEKNYDDKIFRRLYCILISSENFKKGLESEYFNFKKDIKAYRYLGRTMYF